MGGWEQPNDPSLVVHALLLGESHGVLIPVTATSFYSDPQGELVPHIWWFSSGDPGELLNRHSIVSTTRSHDRPRVDDRLERLSYCDSIDRLG